MNPVLLMDISKKLEFWLNKKVELRWAHQANDKAVMEAYDMTKIVDGKKTWLTESETVARLFEMYEKITK